MNSRSFGRVTASVGRVPARAGHEPVRRQAEARQRGNGPGPSDDLGTRCFAAMIPWRRPAAAAAAARQLRAGGRPLGILIAAAAHLRCRRRRAGTSVNSGPLHPPVFACGCNYARVLPDCRSGVAGLVVRGCSRWPRRLRPAGSLGRPRWVGSGGSGYSRDQPGLLPRAAPHTGICPGQSDARHVFA